MLRKLVVLITVVIVTGLVVGAYFYGRDHPAKAQVVATTTTTTTTTTTKPTSIAQTTCGTNSACLTITDKAGDAITVTLDAEEAVSACDTPETGGGPISSCSRSTTPARRFSILTRTRTGTP